MIIIKYTKIRQTSELFRYNNVQQNQFFDSGLGRVALANLQPGKTRAKLMPMAAGIQLDFHEHPYDERYLDSLEQIEKEAGNAKWSRNQLMVITEHLTMDTRLVSAAESFGQPVGFYVVEHSDEVLYISNIAVAKSWRRCGVASFALSAAEDLAKELNYKKMALDVQEQNLPAQLLYRKSGFSVVRINRNHYPNQDGYYMEKELE